MPIIMHNNNEDNRITAGKMNDRNLEAGENTVSEKANKEDIIIKETVETSEETKTSLPEETPEPSVETTEPSAETNGERTETNAETTEINTKRQQMNYCL